MRSFAKLFSGALLVCFMLALTSARTRMGQEGMPGYISDEHKTVLEKWLKQKPNLKVATAEDLDPSLVQVVKDMFPDRADAPFYAVGDFNDDGQKDFAVGLVIKDKPEGLALAVFNGPLGKTAGRPAFYDEDGFGRGAPLFISTDDRGREVLQVGLGTDTRTVLIKPKGKGYYIWVGATQ